MLICDGQIHIWGADTPERPWPAGGHSYEHRENRFSRADMIGEMGRAVGDFLGWDMPG